MRSRYFLISDTTSMTAEEAEFEWKPLAPGRFPTTCWSRIITARDRASPEARAALGELCEAYWMPIHAFIRRKGHDPEQALDLTQDYFARLLEKGNVDAAEPAKGRFRSFLLADCSFFLADHRDRECALKRGGGRLAFAIDARDSEGNLLHEPADGRSPERLFERDWALTLLARVSERLERDYVASGRTHAFRLLKPLLSDESLCYATIAKELGTTEGNVRVAAHRLLRPLRGRASTASRRDPRRSKPSRGRSRVAVASRSPGMIRKLPVTCNNWVPPP